MKAQAVTIFATVSERVSWWSRLLPQSSLGDGEGKKRAYASAAPPLKLVRKRVVRYALSPREEQVVLLLVRGLSNKEIASRCVLSVETVREYIQNIYDKTGIHGRTALLAHLFGSDGP